MCFMANKGIRQKRRIIQSRQRTNLENAKPSTLPRRLMKGNFMGGQGLTLFHQIVIKMIRIDLVKK